MSWTQAPWIERTPALVISGCLYLHVLKGVVRDFLQSSKKEIQLQSQLTSHLVTLNLVSSRMNHSQRLFMIFFAQQILPFLWSMGNSRGPKRINLFCTSMTCYVQKHSFFCVVPLTCLLCCQHQRDGAAGLPGGCCGTCWLWEVLPDLCTARRHGETGRRGVCPGRTLYFLLSLNH